jgi:aryl-alcohol dehydrogenase-like predicted oxidoreductase
MNFGTPGWGCDRDEAEKIVAAFRDAGGTFFDTANVYGGGASEEILGELLRSHRDDVVIATKVALPGPSLRRRRAPRRDPRGARRPGADRTGPLRGLLEGAGVREVREEHPAPRVLIQIDDG